MNQMAAIPAPWSHLPREGSLTSDYYRTINIPERFNCPHWFFGYGCQRTPQPHPCYRTTSFDYGYYPPTIHTVPTSFFPMSQKFSTALSHGGMFRNYSLNTSVDKTVY